MLNLFQHPSLRARDAGFRAIEKQPCVYILANRHHGTLYIGVTSDLVKRLHQHRSGTFPGFTNRYHVRMLVRYELFGDMTAAIAREKQLKAWRRTWKINLIESGNPPWSDLAPEIGLPALRRRTNGP